MRQTDNLGLALYDTTDKMNVTGATNSLNHNMELIDAALGNQAGGASGGAVLYTAQELTDEQQTRARANISAASAEALETLDAFISGRAYNETHEVQVNVTAGKSITKTLFDVSIPAGKSYTVTLIQDGVIASGAGVALYEVYDADGTNKNIGMLKEGVGWKISAVASNDIVSFKIYAGGTVFAASGKLTLKLEIPRESTGSISARLDELESQNANMLCYNHFRLFTDKVVRGHDGGIADYSGYIATDFINLTGRLDNVVSLNVVLYANFGLAFYDKRMKYISGVYGNNAEEYGYSNVSRVQRVTVTLPDDCCYLCASMGKGHYGAGTRFDVSYKSANYKPSYKIPEYYHSDCYFENKYNYIDGLMREKMANGDAFIFITDEHWEVNQGNSIGLIKALYDFCRIPRLFSGGDNGDFGSPEYDRLLTENFGGEIHFTAGNHDYFKHDHQGATLYSYMDIGKENQVGNAGRHYYYVDNRQQKIRYVILSAFDHNPEGTTSAAKNGYEAEQLEWLRNTALDVPADYSVIIFTHSLIPDSIEVVSNNVTSIIDAKNTNNNIVAILQGHAHYDWVAHTEGGIPIVVTTCDKNIFAEGYDDYLAGRDTGTIREQAFDVCILDKTERKLTMVRIGCPVREGKVESEWTYSEERVISY